MADRSSSTDLAKVSEIAKAERSSAARRQARYRQRQRDGIQIVPLPVNDGMIERLFDVGALGVTDGDDLESLTRAIAEVLRDALRSSR
ncbi:hypothetical protein RDV64_01590 [Acuticoccus sp. MNP-M23]|uniref:hypothetical protein n=1 Tax=Acuticoccus sp. MNP-M23 TaxID=3072793 RepID=UPI002816704F|nr:hypothetical protein [Acuticoccus sp. MNP-M23]WMS43125.1 hypothetical protein RDV64_01590 [Acuticoccus sp. MNP-M23]